MIRHESPEAANALQRRLDSPEVQRMEAQLRACNQRIEELRRIRNGVPAGPGRDRICGEMSRLIDRRHDLQRELNAFLGGPQ